MERISGITYIDTLAQATETSSDRTLEMIEKLTTASSENVNDKAKQNWRRSNSDRFGTPLESRDHHSKITLASSSDHEQENQIEAKSSKRETLPWMKPFETAEMMIDDRRNRRTEE